MSSRYRKLEPVDPSTITCDGIMPLSAQCIRCGESYWAPPSTAIRPRKVTCDCGLKLEWPDELPQIHRLAQGVPVIHK